MTYHYTECGLDNVLLEGVDPVQDDAGEAVFTIAKVNRLHAAIARAVIRKPYALTGKELRFLRAEMEMTQAELAVLLGREPLAISRWERGENPIDPAADTLVRLLAQELLAIEAGVTVREASGWHVASTFSAPYRIDASNPDDYRPMDQAA